MTLKVTLMSLNHKGINGIWTSKYILSTVGYLHSCHFQTFWKTEVTARVETKKFFFDKNKYISL